MKLSTLVTVVLLASILSELRVIRNNQEETMKTIEELTEEVVGLGSQVDTLNAVLVELDADVVKILDMLRANDTSGLEAALEALAAKTTAAVGTAVAVEDKADDVLPPDA